jgi:hypothetical protein
MSTTLRMTMIDWHQAESASCELAWRRSPGPRPAQSRETEPDRPRGARPCQGIPLSTNRLQAATGAGLFSRRLHPSRPIGRCVYSRPPPGHVVLLSCCCTVGGAHRTARSVGPNSIGALPGRTKPIEDLRASCSRRWRRERKTTTRLSEPVVWARGFDGAEICCPIRV